MLRNRQLEEPPGENCSLPTDLPPKTTRNVHRKQDAGNPNQAGRKGMLFKHLLHPFPSDSQVRLSSEKSGCLEGLETWIEKKEDGSWACLKRSSQVVGMFS